jgi:hypothetical protein
MEIEVAAWFSQPFFDSEKQAVIIPGAYQGQSMKVGGTREELLDFAESVRRAAAQAPED